MTEPVSNNQHDVRQHELRPPFQRNYVIALVLSVVVGMLGVDRFYLGKIGTGILKLITGGGFGIWYIIDIVLIATGQMRDHEGQPLTRDLNIPQ